MEENEIRSRIMDVIKQLRDLNYSWDDIEKFWKECIDEAKKNTP